MRDVTFPAQSGALEHRYIEELDRRLADRGLTALTPEDKQMVKHQVAARGNGPHAFALLADLLDDLLQDRQHDELDDRRSPASVRQPSGNQRHLVPPTRAESPSNRQQALTHMAAAHARLDESVRRLRERLGLDERELDVADQARWIQSHWNDCAEPREAARITELRAWVPDGTYAVRERGACACLARLSSVAKRLAQLYGWRVAEATTFVLCDREPAVLDFPDVGFETLFLNRPPAFDRISLQVNPTVTPEEVADFYAFARAHYFKTYREQFSSVGVPGEAPKRLRDIKPHHAALASMAWAELCQVLGTTSVPQDWFNILKRARPDLPERWRASAEWKRLRRRQGVAKTAYDEDAWVWRAVRETIDLLMFRRPSRLGRSQRSPHKRA